MLRLYYMLFKHHYHIQSFILCFMNTLPKKVCITLKIVTLGDFIILFLNFCYCGKIVYCCSKGCLAEECLCSNEFL